MSNKSATGQPTMTPDEIAAWSDMARTGRLQNLIADPDYRRHLALAVERRKREAVRA